MNYSANYNNIKSEQVCRTCLIDEGHFFNISDTFDHYTLTQMIQNITNLQIDPLDVYTRFICEKCTQKLREAHTFRNQCLESYRTLSTTVTLPSVSKIAYETEVVSPKVEVEDCFEEIKSEIDENIDCINLTTDLDDEDDCKSEDSMINRYREEAEDPDFVYDEDEEVEKDHHFLKKRYIPVKENKIIFHCPLCNKILHNSGTVYERHIRINHPKRIDDDCFKSECEPIGHILVKKTKKKYINTFKCVLDEFCGKSFPEFEIHMKEHLGKKPLVCEDCGIRTRDNCALRVHRLHKHVLNKKISCNLCDYTTKVLSRLKTHLTTHMNDNLIKCELCIFTFVHQSDVTKHKKKQHENMEPCICAICQKIFSDSKCLVEHWKNHNINVEAPNVCHYCGKKYRLKSKMMSHIALSHEPTWHQCILCGYKTKKKTNLKKHVMGHTPMDKPIKCNLCPYRATRNGTLQNHILRRHTKERAFACDFCDYKAVARHDLKQHIRVHTGEKPFSCTFCNYRSGKQWSLTKHIETHHSTEK